MEGTVKWYNRAKGYGFINGEDGGEYFIHFTAIPKGTFIRENDRVSFEPKDTEKGKQAQNLTLLQKGSEIGAPDEAAAEPAAEEASEEAPAEEDSEEENKDSTEF